MKTKPANNNGNEIVSASGNGFFGNLFENIRIAGGSPGKTLGGFVVAWVAFFLILYVLPLPEVAGIDGSISKLTLPGKAALAVVVWACIVWISEASRSASPAS